jgi:amino acid permease
MFVLTPSASVLASSLNLDGSINWIKFNWFFQIGVNAQSPTVLDLQIRNNPDYLPLLINSIIFGSILIAGITLFFCSKRKINNIIKK